MSVADKLSSQHNAEKSDLFRYKSVLLIDDNHVDNFINEQMLGAGTFSGKIQVEINGRSALNFLHTQLNKETGEAPVCPEYIFVDLNMPVMNGIEFIREFQKIAHTALGKSRIVVLTSSIHHADKIAVQEIDSSILFLNKPLTLEMLSRL